ncbi:MAG: hypothetical protein R2682_02010 [Pyrinomonadaceae bacterium]
MDRQLYKLDWNDTEVRLAKGRFRHTLRRPDAELILQREREIPNEIPLRKDGSYSIPDPTVTEETDAKYYDQLVSETAGYDGRDVPTQHKAAAFQGLYVREIFVDEDEDLFADQVTVTEQIGPDDDPQFVIRHVLAVDERQLQKARRKFAAGHLEHDKRGRQKYVAEQNLSAAMEFYRSWLVRIDGATVNGETFSPATRDAFFETVDPLIQRKVVKTLVDEVCGRLLD